MSSITLNDQIKQFCTLPGNSMYDFAEKMVEYYWSDKILREAWQFVSNISKYVVTVEMPLLAGQNYISRIGEVLGPDIALKLYRYYLNEFSGGPPMNPNVPAFILSDDDFVPMMRKSNLTDDEKLKLHTLQRQTKERREYLERIRNKP